MQNWLRLSVAFAAALFIALLPASANAAGSYTSLDFSSFSSVLVSLSGSGSGQGDDHSSAQGGNGTGDSGSSEGGDDSGAEDDPSDESRPDNGRGNGGEHTDSGKHLGHDKGKARGMARGHHRDLLPSVGRPVQGSEVGAKTAKGSVRVKAPGSSEYTELDGVTQVPVGSLVDASRGAVVLSSADMSGGTQTAIFRGTTFKVSQKQGSAITNLTLRGLSLGDCAGEENADEGVASTSRRRRRGRRLWGRGKGRFRTRGRHSAASVRGTVWMTEDRCDGTVTKVKRGRVVVRDRRLKRTIVLKKGDRYFARAKK